MDRHLIQLFIGMNTLQHTGYTVSDLPDAIHFIINKPVLSIKLYI